jgi:hypothetical protein
MNQHFTTKTWVKSSSSAKGDWFEFRQSLIFQRLNESSHYTTKFKRFSQVAA